jgi:hypothetical protein
MSKKRNRPRFKEGDSVVVTAGSCDADFGVDLGGWQGRIEGSISADDPDPFICIRWDSITLKNLPGSMIERCEEQGLDWAEYILAASEVEPATPRDTEQDVAQIKAELAARYAWSHLGEEGRRINQILVGVDSGDEMACLDAWEDHLTRYLAFPFEAEVDEFQDRGPLQAGDRLKVTGIGMVDDLYGVIVNVRLGRRKYATPLCDLAVVDERSLNHDLVQEYRVWFANR